MSFLYEKNIFEYLLEYSGVAANLRKEAQASDKTEQARGLALKLTDNLLQELSQPKQNIYVKNVTSLDDYLLYLKNNGATFVTTIDKSADKSYVKSPTAGFWFQPQALLNSLNSLSEAAKSQPLLNPFVKNLMAEFHKETGNYFTQINSGSSPQKTQMQAAGPEEAPSVAGTPVNDTLVSNAAESIPFGSTYIINIQEMIFFAENMQKLLGSIKSNSIKNLELIKNKFAGSVSILYNKYREYGNMSPSGLQDNIPFVDTTSFIRNFHGEHLPGIPNPAVNAARLIYSMIDASISCLNIISSSPELNSAFSNIKTSIENGRSIQDKLNIIIRGAQG